MSLLCKSTNIEDAEKIIEALLVVSSSEFVGSDSMGNNIPAQIHKNFLTNLVAHLEPVDISNDEAQTVNSISERDFHISDSATIKNWIEGLKNKSIQQCQIQTDDDNFHYCPEFSDNLCRFLRTFLLWSGVLKSVFKYGDETESSSIVESYFNDLKNRTFCSRDLPLRVDKFFLSHHKAINGLMIISANEREKSVNIQLNEDSEESIGEYEEIK